MMSFERILIFIQLLYALFCVINEIPKANGFVNSPKVVTKDGNLIFESGMNRNITFRLNGKSRITINDQYDLLDLIMLKKRLRNSTLSGDISAGDFEWFDGDETSLRKLASDVNALHLRVYGRQGIDTRLRELQNRSNTATQNLRRYNARLTRIESRVQTLYTRLELDSCKSDPCENGGTCYNLYSGYMCKCTKNFEGPTCAQDVNECALFAGTDLGCQNGGQCVNQFGGYSCICTPGWFGIHCTQRKGDCMQSSTWELCGHGTCVPAAGNDNFGYKCICEQGWKTNGLTPACSVDVDECTETHPPCVSKCINLPGSFACSACPAGLDGNGINCRDIDECATNNGGCSLAPKVHCINTYGSYHCGECPLGWSGDGRSCQRTATNDNSNNAVETCRNPSICYPGANCVEISNTVVCNCPAGMVGNGYGPNGCMRATTKNCGNSPCLNGGTCYDTQDSYACICPPGYKLPNCEPLPNLCASNPCQNNGHCQPAGTTFTCRCQPGYAGRLCTTPVSRCGGVLSGLTGRLKYPEGSAYDHNAQCAWLIRTNETLVLNITFNAFELEDSTECRFDWLQLNDGRTAAAQVIGRFCGTNKPMGGNVITSTNFLYIWFRSDNSTSKEGFDLSWNSITPQCGGIIEVTSHGSIATPGSPGVYPKNRDCRWLLRAPNNKRIKLTFFAMQLENHDSCGYDFVEIKDAIADVVLEKFCNTSRPAPLLLPTNEVSIRFHSDNIGADTGFQIYYSVEERIPGCGGTFTEKHGEINSPALIGNGAEVISCEYDIKMSSSESITIEFIKFNMSSDDCLEIYDVNLEKKLSALQAKYCGGYNIVPGMFQSIYNAVQIKYYAKNGEFQLRYNADCSYTFDEPNGTVTSPGYPQMSKVEHFCTYKIVIEPGSIVSLTFDGFEIKDSSMDGSNDCTYSFLTINDGPNKNILGPFCNDNEPPKAYVAQSNFITMIFQSGPTSLGKGFKLSYRSIPMAATDCGGVFTKPGYSIKLPTDDTGHYLHDLECYWVIMAPKGKGILLNWKSFSLEATFDCTYDYLEIYDAVVNGDNVKPLGRYCNARPPPSFLSHSRLLTIKFVSDYSDSSDGFEATYDFVDITNQCGGEIFSSTGTIYSPGYPEKYAANINCTWIITVPHSSQLELNIELFDLEEPISPTGDCVMDWLEIRNGASANSSLIGRFCGKDIPATIPSFTNQLRITFHTDGFHSGNGFKIGWRVFSNGCGGVLLGDSGVITSPFYPQAYPNDASCEWRIRVHPGSAVILKIEHLDIEDLFQCNYDFLEIFDGHSMSDRPLAKLCRMDALQSVYQTSSNEVLIHFQTDSSNSQSGFFLSYNSICKRNVTAVHGAIESINYGQIYMAKPVDCVWTLSAPKGNKIQIEFTDLTSSDAKNGKIYFKDISKDNKVKFVTINEYQTYESEGSILQIIHNETAVSFRLEYLMVGCIQTLTRDSGEFQTPNYPKAYTNDIECSWTIKVPFGQGIELTVEDMDIEDSVNCTKDGLQISNEAVSDHPKERHCGVVNSFKITSSGHQLYVRFYSDGAHNGKGFKATYKTVKTTCGGKLEGKNGAVTSPNYPLAYPQNLMCEWKIEVAPHYRIKLTLDDLDIEDFYDCEMDYVAAYDTAPSDEGEDEEINLFKKCGTLDEKSETLWITTSNTADVRFKTDDSNEQKGFKLHFEELCGETIYITEEDAGNLEVTKHSQTNDSCEWRIIAKDATKRVMVTATHVQLTPLMAMSYTNEEECAASGVKIYDGNEANGPLRAKFCKTHPPAVVSNGHALTVTVPLNMIAEFEANYMTMDVLCGGLFRAMSGKFSSPYYPSSYPVNLECEWWLEASAGNSLALTFEYLDLEDSPGCNNDYVEVREESHAGRLIGVYCGSNNLPPALHGLNALWIKFKSDNDNVGGGFLASYNYRTHNELSGENGTIESPKYPSKFHNLEPFSYRITVDKEYVVLLSIKHIVDTDMPFIKFYDGYSDIGPQIDYTTSHIVRSNTNILYFTASRGPFQLAWERLSKTEVQKNMTAAQSVEMCGKQLIVVNQAVTFTSPGYPEGYKNNMDCSWHILPSNGATHAVLQFTKVDLEEFADCFADNVAVSQSSDLQNWKELDKLCTKAPNVVKLYHGTPYLKLEFHTDSSSNKTGFSSVIRTACGSTLTDRKGFVNITALPGIMPYQMECVWTIHVRQGRRVRIRFDESKFRNPNLTATDDCRSYFLVRNGIDGDSPFLGKGKYCDNDIEDVLETTTNRAYIKFMRVGYPRFRAAFSYEEIMHECSDDFILGDTPSERMVTIKSPNYPNIPNPHTECIWKITAPVHHILAVHFLDKFDLTPGTGPTSDACEREFVQLNDGATDLMPMLGRYCGQQKPATIYTTGNVLRAKYFTDVAEPKAGFMANITLASCGGFYYDSEGTVNLASTIKLQQADRETAECVYAFEAPTDAVVRIDLAITLPEADNCSTVSHIELQEIDAYGELENITDTMIICGDLQKAFVIETNKLLVILKIKDNYRVDAAAKISYRMLGSRCGETIRSSVGVLQTPGYPNGVLQPVHCVWRVQVDAGKRVKVEILDFDMGGKLQGNSSNQVHTFRGRISFANDFGMQSIIARVHNNPPDFITTTDNLMGIDAFILPIGRNRGFKLRFTTIEGGDICPHGFGNTLESSLLFESNSTLDKYCNYRLMPRNRRTLALTIARFEQREPMILGAFFCQLFAPLKFKTNNQKLLPNLFCKNTTFPITLRFPYHAWMEVLANSRNRLSLLEMNYKQYECGGLLAVYPYYTGENVTIRSPQMPASYTQRLDCAWALWPSEESELMGWEDIEDFPEHFQLEVALSTDFKGKCEEQYLQLYNGPNQDSPVLGRYCGQTTISHLVAEHGLFVEYTVDSYETQSKFNITARQGSGCGGKLHYPYRTIYFTNDYYKNNMECIWTLDIEAGFNLNIVFDGRFFIESSEGCKKDYLRIEQRNAANEDFVTLKTLCGREPPPLVNTTGREVRVIFRSDADTVGDGFNIIFERSCGGILYATKEIQHLMSPGYPKELPNSLFCNWTILAPSVGERGILLRFDSLELERPPFQKCLFDNLTIVELVNDMEVETVLCGVKKQMEFHAQNRLGIILRTDHTFPSRGFVLHFTNNVCGGLITNTTLIESPHNQEDGNYPPNLKCFWNITAPADHKILIKFELLEFESGADCTFDYVEVYKGENAVEDQRLAKFCGNMTSQLPILSININKGIIRSQSDERDPSKGFKALITIVPNCDRHVYLGSENASYEFTTFSGKYENNLDCSYVFKTEPGRQLQIEFISFHIEDTVGCTADYLDIRDGAGPFADEIGRFCGHVMPTRLTSSRNGLMMRFVSDYVETSTGFSARITSIPLLCGKHNVDLETDKKFILKSPEDGNAGYPKNILCFWKIKAATNIHLKFDRLDIESKHENGTCGGDYLKIYNKDDADYVEKGYGSSIVFNGQSRGMDYSNFATEHIYCGNVLPSDYFSYSKEIYLKFKTDGNGTGSGFSLEAMTAQGCYRNFTGKQGRILIADTSDHCDIHILAPENTTLTLYFKSLSFGEYDCEKEYVEIFDAHTNASLKKLCNYIEPGKSLFSNTNELRMRLKMSTQYTEYDMTYLASSDGPGCGGDFYNTAGVFTNPFYPDNVRNNSNCRWNIRVPSNLVVLLRFDVFDLGAKTTCLTDYLDIIEHRGDGTEQVARHYCGGDHPKVYMSTGHFVSVYFHKTVNYDGTGWVLRFDGVYHNYVIPSYYLNNDFD